MERADPKPNVVVIGSSFIGMEAASVLTKVATSVTVIGMEEVPFERVLGVKVGTAMQKLHEEKGVKFFMKAVVDQFVAAGTCAAQPATNTPAPLVARFFASGFMLSAPSFAPRAQTTTRRCARRSR